ncbi:MULTISPECIES: hypothetical protein [unclassified Haloferax]|jgi:hypothetical protein|uniref:hypothetical protein n=1 Tax=unclassified Haloferax TaxID=2625095 RepID=UPI0028740135|nr:MULTISPECIES: hypothetical protein [unclassified Haloferax]MDS0243093.1 hypothetical protein [Haloferax sp. S2CR25]MDS0446214.1 hypothetical protein [Haloferax sp. S2CR25-2]
MSEIESPSTGTRTDPSEQPDAEIIETAKELHATLLTYAGCTAAIEANTYRMEIIPNELTNAIRGWGDWTEATAERFVEDCVDVASAEIENMWWKALRDIDHPAVAN